MFEDLLGGLEMDSTTALYGFILAGIAGLLAFWMVNRIETVSSIWAVFSGIFTMIISFIVTQVIWSR